MNKAVEEKTKESKEEEIKQQDDDVKQNKQQEQRQHLSLSAQAYKLFSERKTPLEVAIALNLRESEATKFYKDDIEERKNKISILDKIAFSSELERKRTEQRVQELGNKKDRLEKFIANISNGEGYSKLKQIVKENVKG